MEPIRWFPGLMLRLGRMCLGAGIALVLTAAPAAAEISSVDAYGGQAQVLGPVHHGVRTHGSTTARGSNEESAHGAATTGAPGPGESAGPPANAGSGSAGSSGSTGGSSSAGSAAASGSQGVGGGGAGAVGRGQGDSSGVAGGGQTPPIAATNASDVSNDSLSLSALDVLLLVAILLVLLGAGALIRHLSRQSE